ncbi:nuclear transport factor 2 family protein [Aquabacterium sp. A7-Y]|uniref:YybH family protein n=1 Tax=Aquabacterium sp. A7-Y TaxID=1349605 RepID=UPI00223D24F2|nr:nuclear transport factor 2 family protein [Aquabacterium sp. A7-Y]MCW7540023.1 nuclear transport factor 2 family protein [Aquabacterium sp. A7-Y]
MPRPPATLASPEDIEAQFYEALQQGDIEKMMSVWSDDDEIVCIHPGGPRLLGAAAIRAAFEQLFAAGNLEVRPEKVRRINTLTTAVHSVVEQVRHSSADGLHTGTVLATNVYVKTPLGWRLVCHHASSGAAVDLQDLGGSLGMLH